MKFKFLLPFFVVFFSLMLNGQTQEKEVLFTVENEPVYTSEFISVYNKNLELVKDESQKNIDTYLQLFVNYKLKLKEAQALGLDKKSTYLRELNGYKKQLSRNYLSDNKVTNALLEEAYSRMQNEVNARHILIRIDENARPQDTIAAYNEVLKLRNRVLTEGFEAVQKDVHNGKTIFAEDLGYFSAFKMVYDFENAAYNTKSGEVSQPFRTRFGFHIVNVIDNRPARGEASVAHIMVSDNTKNPNSNAEARINEIFKRIQQGESFEALAKQFSEDKSSSSKGGKLEPFSGGQLSSMEFEDTAFNLKEKGEVSNPFKTEFGWHIIMLHGIKKLEPFDEIKGKLQAKIKRDSRSQLINASRVSALKKKYNVSEDQPALTYFSSIITKEYQRGNWTLPENFEGDKLLLKIKDKNLTYKDFGQFLIKSQRRSVGVNSFQKIVEKNYMLFFENELLKYQEENLEAENEEYAKVVGEYRDGLLLFDLMETEIWNAAKKDSLALKKYYNDHKANYFFEERINAVVASSAKKSQIKNVMKLLEKDASAETIKNELNTNGEVNVSFTTGEMNANHQALPKDFKFNVGTSKIYKHNDAYVVVKVNTVLPKTAKSYEEARGRVISDYQVYKEENWLKELANKYTVTINKSVLDTVKSKINN